MASPNKEQKRVIEEGLRFLRSDSKQVFQFSGLAATGKSWVLNYILQESRIDRNRVAPMAYIGQAATNMRFKGITNAKTIHSWLYKPVEDYMTDKDGNIIMDTYFNKPKSKLGFEPKPLDDIDLILVDEGYTVPLSMREEIESRGKKIIVTGDNGQLPPVGEEPAYLREDDPDVMSLTQIMVQDKNSHILYLADRARRNLPIHSGYYGDVLVIDEDELTNEMIMHSDIVIAGRNDTRDRMNKRIRHEILNIGTDLPVLGERMICRKNNWTKEVDGINLTNGLLGTVVNSPGIDGFDGKSFKLDFKPNLLNSYFSDLRCDYKYLIAPYKDKQYLKNNKYELSEKMDWGYCNTVHLLQGARFNNGIYLEEYIHPDVPQNKLNYTAVTRFANSLIYVKKKRKKYYNF